VDASCGRVFTEQMDGNIPNISDRHRRYVRSMTSDVCELGDIDGYDLLTIYKNLFFMDNVL